MKPKTSSTRREEPEDEYFSGNGSNDDEDDPQGDPEDEAIDVDKKKKNDKEEEEENDGKVKKIRVITRKPQPKLDSMRLCGPRGLKCLHEHFDKFKPKGEGHEFQDLETIMNKYEYWAHRLFPKMKFSDVIEKMEKLGEKREVKSTLHRMRLGEGEGDGEDGTHPSDAPHPNENDDPMVENEAMTNRVMGMINKMSARDNRDSEESDDDDDNGHNSNSSNRAGSSTIRKNQINDEEDEDEILRSLLNV